MTQTEYQETKEKILAAAIQVFSERGKQGARMQEIADLAKVNKAMLFYYFTNKDSLYSEVLKHIMTQILKNINKVTLSGDRSEIKIEKIVNTYIDFIKKNQEIPRLITSEMSTGAETLKTIILELKESDSFNLPLNFIKMFQEGIKSGSFRGMDPAQTIISIIGISIFYFIAKPIIHSMLNVQEEDQDKFLKIREKHIIDLLQNGILVRK